MGTPDTVEIRWTTHGVAHIRSDTWGGLGFGQGYACARDHLPTIADQIVKVTSERALHFGPGPLDANIASDFGYLALGVVERAADLRAAQPPEMQALVAGYVDGYNHRVEEAHDTDSLPDWCRGARWIQPIDELELYAYLGDVAMLASGRNLASLIGRAEAPGPDGPAPASPLEGFGGSPGASNGWAVGGDVTESGCGMVLANPHFPWYGEARFWECHLTIPGELDVYGVALLGTPGVQMGFTEGVAWAHTFSCGHRFTVQRMDLTPGDPTSYRYGEEVRRCTSRSYEVGVREPDGSVRKVGRTLWRSHQGPMLNLPLVGWGTDVGFSYRDANVDNFSVLQQFVGMGRATDLDGFRRVFEEVNGMPWVNTLAADRSGRAWYCDASATPRLSSGAQRRFADRLSEDLVAALLYENRVALIDGSEPDDEWLDHPDARSPGLEPFSSLPQLERRDILANANDSHWLPHPKVTLEGFPTLCGFERTARSFRTRQNLLLADDLARRGGVRVEDLLDAVFDNRSLTADLFVDGVVDRCRAAADAAVADHDPGASHPVAREDLERVADVLADWDRRADVGSVGAVLWREILVGFPANAWREAGPLMRRAFDPEQPLTTPAELSPAPDDAPDPLLEAVRHALRVLVDAGVPIDAPLGDVQWAARGTRRVPVHGGGEAEGMLNVLGPIGALPSASLEPGPPSPAPVPGRERTGLGAGGYQVSYGTSFLMAVELTEDGPEGYGLLAYGQSGDPRSPYHHAGTDSYAAKQVRPLLFRDADIDADPALERRTLTRVSRTPET